MGGLACHNGKRIRPYLGYLTYTAYGGPHATDVADVFLASELYHQAMLIHDDIIDGDTQRYDRNNIVGTYAESFAALPQKQGKNLATAMAVIAGDVGISFAFKAILEHPTLAAHTKVALANLLNQTNLGGQAGQQLDTLNIAPFVKDFSSEKVLLTHLLKSSLYTTMFPMQCAGTLLDLPKEEMGRIDRFARPLGILYQLVDDYSDYFDNSTGFDAKPKYRDYRQGKLTVPLHAALQAAAPADAQWLEDNFGKESDCETLAKVRAIIKASGAQQQALSQIYTLADDTHTALQNLSVSDETRPAFTSLINTYAPGGFLHSAREDI